MPAQAHLLRLFHLVRRLQQVPGQAVPFAELRRHLLEHPSLQDFPSGYELRTFQRDRHLIADNFGLTIQYCRRGQGYRVTETDLMPGGHQRLLDALELQEFLRLPRALGPYVQPETRRPQGLEHLRPLLRAAQVGQVVDFAYQKFWEDAPERRTAGPLLLKEFRGRWYVLAAMVGSGRLACFGLDRISDFSATAQKFTPPVGFDARTYFANCFGITRPADGPGPQEILLCFAPVQGRYALSYPLHASQQVVPAQDDEIRLRLTVYDTHELRMELLSYGPDVEVLAPAGLRAWVQQAHTAAAQRG